MTSIKDMQETFWELNGKVFYLIL